VADMQGQLSSMAWLSPTITKQPRQPSIRLQIADEAQAFWLRGALDKALRGKGWEGAGGSP
jgi:hypothetical protein